MSTCPPTLTACRAATGPPAVDASSPTPMPHPPPEPRVRPAAAAAAGATILLVDDEPMICTLGRLTLEPAGYRVLTAGDGVEAVEVFARERDRIDLVVLDVTMPRMTGREAFRQIVGLRPAARILFSTGYSAEDLTELAHAVGLLPKPYRPAELLTAVRAALAPGEPGA